MKAYEIMMFLLLVNVSLSLVGGLGIYNFGFTQGYDTGDDTYNVTGTATQASDSLASRFLGQTILALVVGAIGGAIFAKLLGGVPSDSAVAYNIFASVYWASTLSALSILWTIVASIGSVNIGVVSLLVIFIMVAGVSFVTGFLQLVRGGWGTFL